MLNSNVNDSQMKEILDLVPDTVNIDDEFWRVVPNTQEGIIYSVSSKRDILVKHTCVDTMGRVWKHKLIKMSYDCGVYNTSIKRSNKNLSTYIEHIRYDAFPELNVVKTLEDDVDDAIDVPYEGLDWFGRKKVTVHIIPVTDSDMYQVRRFYPEDLPREIWAYVPETNRKYVISSQGRGVILKRYSETGTILKAQKWQLKSGHNKYYDCCLTVGNRQFNSVAHAQILRSFISKPVGDIYEVNHIDGDTHNNVLDNLEWVTRQQNSDHYNKSPEMLSKRKEGYKKISEWGKLHQKEIQTREDVNKKRSETLKKGMTEERKQQMSIASKKAWTAERRLKQSELTRSRWLSYSDEEKAKYSKMLSDAGVRGTRKKHANKLSNAKSENSQ